MFGVHAGIIDFSRKSKAKQHVKHARQSRGNRSPGLAHRQFREAEFSPNNACVVGFLLSMYISWLRKRDFRWPVAGSGLGLADSVAGGRGCGWQIRWPVAVAVAVAVAALVQIRCVWLGLEL